MSLRFNIKNTVDIDKLFSYLNSVDFTISNPDCIKGNSFDVIPERKVAGFDILWDNSPPSLLLYNEENLRFYGRINRGIRESV